MKKKLTFKYSRSNLENARSIFKNIRSVLKNARSIFKNSRSIFSYSTLLFFPTIGDESIKKQNWSTQTPNANYIPRKN